ncbi:unnamed protein product [Phytophthora fragariaefolia]|uniref:Unnamed protein product n=1 Tax=Phytophthora fragariaefolia TaxID=1490495 RepID=A0A9W6X167_9STRA|nr:unnamed protein product [Phytophthora fragariaefolia]
MRLHTLKQTYGSVLAEFPSCFFLPRQTARGEAGAEAAGARPSSELRSRDGAGNDGGGGAHRPASTTASDGVGHKAGAEAAGARQLRPRDGAGDGGSGGASRPASTAMGDEADDVAGGHVSTTAMKWTLRQLC